MNIGISFEAAAAVVIGQIGRMTTIRTGVHQTDRLAPGFECSADLITLMRRAVEEIVLHVKWESTCSRGQCSEAFALNLK